MSLDALPGVDPNEAIKKPLAAKAEIVPTGRADYELSYIDGLVAKIQKDNSFAPEAWRKLTSMRAERQRQDDI